MLNLSTFWKQKKRYRFILKGGASFIIRAEDLNITYKTADLTITAYKFTGIEGSFPLHIVVGEIAAIVRL